MDPATVFFTDFRCSDAENLQRKFTRLLKTAGLAELDLARKFVAIKTHFGEGGCLAYLRPNWAKTLVDFVKAQGGRPFLTDANTLYVGRRKDALEHLELAWENGFSPFSVGCPILIADGLRGTDDVAVPLPDSLGITVFSLRLAPQTVHSSCLMPVASLVAALSITHWKLCAAVSALSRHSHSCQ